jgi:hypothetical protein
MAGSRVRRNRDVARRPGLSSHDRAEDFSMAAASRFGRAVGGPGSSPDDVARLSRVRRTAQIRLAVDHGGDPEGGSVEQDHFVLDVTSDMIVVDR